MVDREVKSQFTSAFCINDDACLPHRLRQSQLARTLRVLLRFLVAAVGPVLFCEGVSRRNSPFILEASLASVSVNPFTFIYRFRIQKF